MGWLAGASRAEVRLVARCSLMVARAIVGSPWLCVSNVAIVEYYE
jgi:hypothetical protein